MRNILTVFFTFSILASLAQESTLSRPDIPGELMVDVGLNFWDETPEDLSQNAWPSKSVSIYYTKRKVLTSKISFNYGVGLGLEKIDLGTTNTLFSQNDDVTIDDFPFDNSESPVDKNKLSVTYLDVPVEFRFHPKGTEDGEGLFIGVGGIAGLRLNSHVKWKYPEDGEDVIQKTKGAYDLNVLRLGAQVRIGFRGIHLFYKQYFSDMFNDSVGDSDVNPRMSTIGINVTGF